MARCVVLPSLPTSMFIDISAAVRLTVRKITFEEFAAKVRYCDSVINYNRHPPTNQLLSKYVSFTTGAEYRLATNDVIFVVGLKARTPISGQDVIVTENDLLVLEVQVE